MFVDALGSGVDGLAAVDALDGIVDEVFDTMFDEGFECSVFDSLETAPNGDCNDVFDGLDMVPDGDCDDVFDGLDMALEGA